MIRAFRSILLVLAKCSVAFTVKDDAVVALMYGTLSALTLPLGAAFGCYFVHVSETTIAFMVAFGAGALLFAVTVELYGEAVDRLETHGFRSGLAEMTATGCGALLGAVIYILCCRWIDWAVESVAAESVTDRIESGGSGDDGEGQGRYRQPGIYSAREMNHVRGRKRAVMGALDPALHKEIHSPSKDDALNRSIKSEASSSHTTYGATESGAHEGSSAKGSATCDIHRVNEIRVAIFIWLGALLDGIPEAIMLGYLAAERKLSMALVIALFVSNFPESFSSAVLLVKHGIARWKVIAMWAFLCVFTGVLACLTAYVLPDSMLSKKGLYKDDYWYLKLVGALIEGMAGGAMLACISNVMLPDAFRRRGDMVGIFVMSGFLMAVMVKVFGGIVDEIYYQPSKTQ